MEVGKNCSTNQPAEVAEGTEVAKEEVAEESPQTPPPTPTPKPRKKAVRISRPPAPTLHHQPVPTLDADFWASMLTTKRQMDLEATRTRYSNLVVFK